MRLQCEKNTSFWRLQALKTKSILLAMAEPSGNGASLRVAPIRTGTASSIRKSLKREVHSSELTSLSRARYFNSVRSKRRSSGTSNRRLERSGTSRKTIRTLSSPSKRTRYLLVQRERSGRPQETRFRREPEVNSNGFRQRLP